jgi:hypothetical protein
MTYHNVSHANHILKELKEQHQKRIEYLENKIQELQTEIELLKNYQNKIYDC